MRTGFIIIFLASFMLLVNCANSSVIEVGMSKDLKCNISSFSYDHKLNMIKFDVEVYNTGTVGYLSRVKVDVFDKTVDIFTGWGMKNTLMPGDRKNSEIYWYSNSTGNFTARVRIYYEDEILEKEFDIEKNTSSVSDSIFEIKNFRVYDAFVVLDID